MLLLITRGFPLWQLHFSLLETMPSQVGEIQHKGNINEHIYVCMCVWRGGEWMKRKMERGREGKRKKNEEKGKVDSPYFLGTQSSPSVNLDSCTIR